MIKLRKKSGRVLLLLMLLVVVGIMAGELLVRSLGFVDFPLYEKSLSVGYNLRPNQRGLFLNKNEWYVNEEGFNNDKPFNPSHPYTILVGDSVVYGGNPVDYKKRIGAITEGLARQNIWVAAAGGWSLINELAFLEERKELLMSASNLVFILNNGDFDEIAEWQGELTFPTKKPLFASIYILRRYMLPHISELPPIKDTSNAELHKIWAQKLDRLLEYYLGPVTIILYPDQRNLYDGELWKKKTRPIKIYVNGHHDRIRCIDLIDDPSWTAVLYRDNIHPNEEGNKRLGKIIANAIVQTN